jgi:membrane protein implicated in regulation of membrane protease activity
MIIGLVHSLGAWSWVIFGAVLLVAEILLPGNFLIWVGIAGVIVGLASLGLWEASWWIWQLQWLAFAMLSALAVFAGRRFLNLYGGMSDQPMLNQRTDSLVGRTADLIDPLVNGFGRVKLGDTVWIVTGPDLPAGARVRVIGGNGSDLKVEAA